MDLLHVAVTSLVSLAAMFLLTKLMGNKQVSQMNLFDYVIGITIGSIAAEMATELDTPENSLLAMAVYAVAAVCISLLTNKSLRVRQLMTGKPLILMDGGTLYRKNLKIAKMDLSEFLMYCRIGGQRADRLHDRQLSLDQKTASCKGSDCGRGTDHRGLLCMRF